MSNSLKKGRYTKYSNKIGLYSQSKGGFIGNDNDVVLNFPFKDTVLEAGMSKEDVGRDERFLHIELDSKDIDTLEEPKVLTDFKYIDKDGEKTLTKDSDIEFFDEEGNLTQNLLIKGNNLLALYTLRERLAGKVKLIYIDPPYNTKGDSDSFAYNNSFKHSSWLVFMKNRLEVAKELLREDGFISIAIDHAELFYLGVLADEIFGEDNRLGIISVVHKPEGRNQEKFVSASNEYMLIYAKNKSQAIFKPVFFDEEVEKQYDQKDDRGYYKLENYLRGGGGDHNLRKNKPHFFYPIFVDRDNLSISLKRGENTEEVLPITNTGQERTWKTKNQTFLQRLEDNRIVAVKDKTGKMIICEKYYKHETGQLVKSHWVHKKYNAIYNGTKLLELIIGNQDFSFPKSLYLLTDTIQLMTEKDDIILDFFAGSATTAHATMYVNNKDGGDRKFVVTEQLDYIENVSKKRLSTVIKDSYRKNSFVYLELKKYNQEYVDLITKATTLSELEEIYVEMRNNAFLKFWFDRKDFEKDEDFRKLDLAERKKVLIDVLDENQLYLNYPDMYDSRHNVSEDEKILTEKFYGSDKN
jgi:adenine-specific DNA-methyltransferase